MKITIYHSHFSLRASLKRPPFKKSNPFKLEQERYQICPI